MIYPQNFETKTGFDKVRRLITDKCLSPLGEERVAEMDFSADYATVNERLEQTDEFLRILHGDTDFPSGCYFDVRYSLKRIRPEGTYLDEKELFDLKRSLETINDIVRFFRSADDEDEIEYPALTALSGDIQVFPALIGKIDSILDKYGRVKDNASPGLAQIRKEISVTMNGISRSLQSILRAAQSEGVVDKDVSPTMRDGRLMIPVAPAFKRKIRGIVHDESASGKTVFIEPEVVVEANNRIRELEGEERREILKILTTFTNVVRPMVPEILQSYEFMAEIDFIRAKALFTEQIKGIRPVVENKQQIDWVQAVHPLLYLSLQKQNKQVIPLDITLDEQKRILIISGPNAGGKSVCLKTVGLLQYMLQCGLPIPLHESSRAGLFEHIFIDIGDEQSIENDLSTYSSHLTNMKYFVRNCNPKTVILIDEFGSGTEPQIGGAIAEALLERFNGNHSFGVITTHYQNLKHFAEGAEGIINGAMLYDRHLMQPLFKLSIGNPGSSFAVEIARKIGLPEEVIADAAAKVGSDYIDMDKYLQDIVRDKRYWESKRQNIRQQEKKLEEITARYSQDLEEVNKQRKEIMREAKAEAARILSDANARIENTIREIKEAQAEKEQTKMARKALEDFKASVVATEEMDDKIARQMAKLKERNERKKEKQKYNSAAKVFDKEVIATGDFVRLKGQVSAGTVIEVQGKQALIAFGMIKSTVKLEMLEKVSKGQIKKEVQKSTFVSTQTTDSMHEKKLNFKQE
ncbi:MAG: MutS2/Smr-associated SH3 domain-containing protein, partial [Tannerellaceae bacterium]